MRSKMRSKMKAKVLLLMKDKVTLTTIFVMTVLLALAWQTDTAKGKGFITDGLLSYWNFEDIKGDTVKDVWGNRDGKMIGDTKVVKGKFGDALEFDGAGDYVDYEPKGLPEGKAPRTMSAWVKPEGAGVRAVLEWGTNVLTQRSSILIERNEQVKFCGQGADLLTADSIPLGEWSLITETYDGTIIRIYFDGELVSQQAIAINTTLGENSFGRIGANIKVPVGEFMNGSIDEAGIYDRMLDEKEVMQNFEAGRLELAVDSAGKLALTWGKIKVSR